MSGCSCALANFVVAQRLFAQAGGLSADDCVHASDFVGVGGRLRDHDLRLPERGEEIDDVVAVVHHRPHALVEHAGEGAARRIHGDKQGHCRERADALHEAARRRTQVRKQVRPIQPPYEDQQTRDQHRAADQRRHHAGIARGHVEQIAVEKIDQVRCEQGRGQVLEFQCARDQQSAEDDGGHGQRESRTPAQEGDQQGGVEDQRQGEQHFAALARRKWPCDQQGDESDRGDRGDEARAF